MVAQTTQSQASKVEYEAVADKNNPGDWRVEGIDFAQDGQVYIAIFTGPLARERAEEYASWKNTQPATKTQPQRR